MIWRFIKPYKILFLFTLLAMLLPTIAFADTAVYTDREYSPSRNGNYDWGNQKRTKIAVVILGDPKMLVHEKLTQNIRYLLSLKFPRSVYDLDYRAGAKVKTVLNEKLEDYLGGALTEEETAPVPVETEIMTEESEIKNKTNGKGAGAAAVGKAKKNNDNLKDKIFGIGAAGAYSENSTKNGKVTRVRKRYTREERPYLLPSIDADSLGVDSVPYYGSLALLDHFKKDEFVKAGRAAGADYVLVLPFYYDYTKEKKRLFSFIRQGYVTMRGRMLNVSTGEYIYRDDVMKIGEAGSTLIGNPSKNRAFRKAINYCVLDALENIPIGNNVQITPETRSGEIEIQDDLVWVPESMLDYGEMLGRE